MARLKVALLALAILPCFASGQQSPLNHTVVRGETLWGLAERYYQDPFLWPRIWEANRVDVVDPHLILPDQVLVIPGLAGPADIGPAIVGDIDVRQTPQTPEEEAQPEEDPRTRVRTVFYRDPETGSGIGGGTPRQLMAVPRHTVYSAEWLVEDGESLESIGTIDSFVGTGELRSALPYTRVQVGLNGGPRLSVGDRLQSFRPGRTMSGVGQVMRPTSVLTVTRVEEAGVVAVVLDAFDRVRQDDLVRPAPAFDLQLGDVPDAVIAGGTALILGFGVVHVIQAMGDVAFLDRGEAQGVKIGDEYVLVSGGTEGWSGDVAGRLQVVGTRANNAAARIIAIVSPDFMAGVTVHLDRKMR